MTTRRLIYVCAHRVTAFHWRAGALTEEGSFDATAAGQLQFAGYLAENPKGIFLLLANVSEEGFHIETIPFLRGSDRQAIVARKLGQAFFNATLTAAISLGHEKTRRKDERIMLAAFTNNEAFAPWLSAMARAEVALAGLYSLPLLGPTLLRKLGVSDERCLLLTIQDQSIRQSYVEKGELHFSRLTPLHHNSAAGIAQVFADEALKLQQYLVSQRVIGRKQPITAYLLTHASTRTAIENRCGDSETLSFTILDIADSAHKCGLKALPADTDCEPLFLKLLTNERPAAQFASDDQRHDYHLSVVRAALRGVGAVVLLGCLLWSGKEMFDAARLNDEIEVIKTETELARRGYENIVKTFPPIPTTSQTLRGVINRYIEFEKASVLPDQLYRAISRALQGAASVELEAIEWKATGGPLSRAAGSAEAGRSTSLAGESETAIVRGSLRLGPDSSPRQVLHAFNRLLDVLRLNPGLEVEVLQQPFDVESGKSLKGGDAAIEDQQTRPFKVQIRRAVGG